MSGEEVGGTWHHNTYPGCACDVWTTLYQFTFAQNPDWSRFVAPAAEIKRYLETFAAEHGLYPHIQFGTRVRSAAWRQDEAVWKVVTDKGGHAVVTRVMYQAARDCYVSLCICAPRDSCWPGRAPQQVPHLGVRRAAPARAAAAARHPDLRRPQLPLRPLGPRRGHRRQEGGYYFGQRSAAITTTT